MRSNQSLVAFQEFHLEIFWSKICPRLRQEGQTLGLVGTHDRGQKRKRNYRGKNESKLYMLKDHLLRTRAGLFGFWLHVCNLAARKPYSFW
jgi:hypothetical protein